jgi:hypothetical protein
MLSITNLNLHRPFCVNITISPCEHHTPHTKLVTFSPFTPSGYTPYHVNTAFRSAKVGFSVIAAPQKNFYKNSKRSTPSCQSNRYEGLFPDRIRWQLATDHALYEDRFKNKEDIQGAKEQLTKAIDLFKECGADGWVRKYEKEMAKLT